MKIFRNGTEYTLDANEALETYCEYQLYHDTLFVEQCLQTDACFAALSEEEKKASLRDIAIDMRNLIEDGEHSKTAAFYAAVAEFYKERENHKEGYALIFITSENDHIVQRCGNKEDAIELLRKTFCSLIKNTKRFKPKGSISEDGMSAKVIATECGITRETKLRVAKFRF